MKKNPLRKLTLSRETLLNLTDAKGGAIGGTTQYSVCPESCGIACTVRHLSCTCEIE